MNYLAHLFLAGNDTEIILGNFIADHVKGSDVLSYSKRVQRGIRMHRAIDAFTDSNPTVHEGIVRLRPYFHKYSGVVVDMYYDHYLSKHWQQYSAVSLERFSRAAYDLLNENLLLLPERSARLLYYMEKQNWLVAYASFDGLQQAFGGMARRTDFVSNMEQAVLRLTENYEVFESDFRRFFPELQQFVNENFGADLVKHT